MSNITEDLPLTNVKTWRENGKYTLAYTIQGYIALGYKISAVVPLEYKIFNMHGLAFGNELSKALIVFEK